MSDRRAALVAILMVIRVLGASGQGAAPPQARFRSTTTPSVDLPTDRQSSDPAIANGTETTISGRLAAEPGATLTFHWTPSDLPGGVTAADMQPVHWDGKAWTTLVASARGQDSLVFAVAALGRYAVRWVGPARPCTDSAYRALDYRLGKWDYLASGYQPGHSEVYEAPNRCAIDDRYTDTDGGRSRSFIVYLPDKREWMMTTIDPVGRTELHGRAWRDSAAFYSSATERTIYRRRPDGTVGLSVERSKDDGATWQVWATALYSRIREE
ncbi:MAG TPA: hypothetical protein VGM77_01550 [Gemmatimonadales bacterium]|jgi:hypothetical protein